MPAANELCEGESVEAADSAGRLQLLLPLSIFTSDDVIIWLAVVISTVWASINSYSIVKTNKQ